MSKQYLYRVSILNKKSSHPLESIAYYCGETQYDLLNSKQYQTTTENKVVWNNIIIPDRDLDAEKYSNLPDYLKFRTKKQDLISNARNILWQNIYVREKRADSQFARLFELVIPSFLSQEISVSILQEFSLNLINEGMIVDGSLHSHITPVTSSIFEKLKLVSSTESKSDEPIQQDYTSYLMCTLRDYSDGQFINKNRDWNSLDKMREWRQQWVNILSSHIEKSDVDESQKNVWLKKFSIYKSTESKKKPSI